MQLSIPRTRAKFEFDSRWILIGVPVLLVAYLTMVPLAMLITGTFKAGDPGAPGGFTLQHLQDAYADTTIYPLLFNSLGYALGASLLAFVIGTTLAWIIERTDVPFKSFFFSLTLVPFIIPGVLYTISWIYLLSPRIGFINRVMVGLFNLPEAPFDIFSLGGMIWVEAMHLSPVVFVLMTAALRSMDPALEEAALASGATMLTTLRRVTLRLMLPAVGSVLLIMFIRALEGFEVPAFIGLPVRIRVFTSRIYLALRDFPPDYGLAGAYSLALIALSAIGIYFYNRATARSEQFATVTGKAFRPRKFELGKWRGVAVGIFALYFLLIVGLPFFILLWGSLVPFFTPPSWDMLGRLTFDNYKALNVFACQPNQSFCLRARQAFSNSVMLGVGAATIVMIFTSVVAWINVRTRWPGRTLLDLLTFLPITIPGLVVAVSLMWVYLSFGVGDIYGTWKILLIAYVTRFMPYGMRTISATIVQINRELEEASQVAGASWVQTFRRITIPLLKPGLVAGWVYILIVSMRELSTSVLLAGPQTQVLATLIFDLRDSGNATQLAALSVLFMVLLVLLVTVAHFLGGKFGIQE